MTLIQLITLLQLALSLLTAANQPGVSPELKAQGVTFAVQVTEIAQASLVALPAEAPIVPVSPQPLEAVGGGIGSIALPAPQTPALTIDRKDDKNAPWPVMYTLTAYAEPIRIEVLTVASPVRASREMLYPYPKGVLFHDDTSGYFATVGVKECQAVEYLAQEKGAAYPYPCPGKDITTSAEYRANPPAFSTDKASVIVTPGTPVRIDLPEGSSLAYLRAHSVETDTLVELAP